MTAGGFMFSDDIDTLGTDRTGRNPLNEVPSELIDGLADSVKELREAIDPTWSMEAQEICFGLESFRGSPYYYDKKTRTRWRIEELPKLSKLLVRVDRLLDEPLMHPIAIEDNPADNRYFALSRLMRARHALGLVEAVLRLQV